MDGLGLAVDAFNYGVLLGRSDYYQRYHHFLGHGIAAALVVSLGLACFGRNPWRVALLAMVVFHLHLFLDLIGSRGPSQEDLWPIFYFGPFQKDPMWLWKGQWPLDAWRNRLFGAGLFILMLMISIRRGDSALGVFNRRADRVFVSVLQKWAGQLGLNRQKVDHDARPG